MPLVKVFNFLFLFNLIFFISCGKSVREEELEHKKKLILHEQLFLSIKRGDLDNVESLLDHGADINMKTKDELINPLQYAYQNKQIKIARYLISEGAIVRAKSDNLSTALHEAAEVAGTEDMELLLSKGADINAQNIDGDTPLLIALYRSNFNAALELIESDAKLDIKNYKGISPLYYASGKGFDNIVEKLIRYDADLNIATQSGTRPLHISVSNGYFKIVKMLVNAGANINIMNKYRKRPIDYVKENIKIKQYLKENGAIPGSKSY